MTDRQSRNMLRKPVMDFVHRHSTFIISVVSSLQARRVQRETEISAARSEAGRRLGQARRGATDVSGATSGTTALEAHVSD